MYFVIAIIAITFLIVLVPTSGYSHLDACHEMHSCPAHSGEYECGDLGYDHQCLIVNTLANISLEINRENFVRGDTIVVHGTVNTIFEKTPVIIQILYEVSTSTGTTYNIIEIAQINPAIDGSFADSFIADGNKWEKLGTYIVKATYNEYIKEKSIIISSDVLEMKKDTFEVNTIDRGFFDIDYEIGGGEIKDISVDSKSLGLQINIDAKENGSIILELPREWIDSINSNEKDVAYIVLIDGAEVEFKETKTTSKARTIQIDFLKGEKQIQIIGTYVVPEFGAVLLILIASIIIIASLNKVSFFNKVLINK